MTINLPEWLNLAIGIVLPLLVGLVTRSTASSAVRAVLLAALSALTGFLTEWLYSLNISVPINWQTAIIGALSTFLVAVGAQFGFWRPTGATDAVKNTGGFIGGSIS